MIDQTSRPELTGEQGEVLANPEQFLASATEYLVDTGMVDRDQITPEVAQHIRNVGEVIGIAPDQAIYYHPNNGKEVFNNERFGSVADRSRPGGEYANGILERLGIRKALRSAKESFREMILRLGGLHKPLPEVGPTQRDLLSNSTLEVNVINKAVFADESRESWPPVLRELEKETPPNDFAALVYNMGLVEMGLNNIVIMTLRNEDGQSYGAGSERLIRHLMQQAGMETKGFGGGPKGELHHNPNCTMPVPGTESGNSPFTPQVEMVLGAMNEDERQVWMERERSYWKRKDLEANRHLTGKSKFMNMVGNVVNRYIKYPNLPQSTLDVATGMQLHTTQITSTNGIVAMSPHIDIGQSPEYHVPIGVKKDFNTGNGLGMPLQLLLMSRLIANNDIGEIVVTTHNGTMQADPSIAIADYAMLQRSIANKNVQT